MRGGAEAARWAHNPKVAGSSPAPATKKTDLLARFFVDWVNHGKCLRLFFFFQLASNGAVNQVYMNVDT